MAIAVDSRNAGAKTTGATTISWTHTVAGGLSNSILMVGAATGAPTAVNISSVVWDSGGANTALSNTINGSGANKVEANGSVKCYLWFLLAPASGAKTILVTAASSCEITGGSSSWSGVDQTTPFNAASPQTVAPAQGTNPSITVTSASGEEAIDCACWNLAGATTAVVGAGQTQIFNQNVGSGKHIGAGSDEASSGATVTMSWTGTQASDFTASVAVSMIAASGGGGANWGPLLGLANNRLVQVQA